MELQSGPFFFSSALSGGPKTLMGPFRWAPGATEIFKHLNKGAFWAQKGPESAFLDSVDLEVQKT